MISQRQHYQMQIITRLLMLYKEKKCETTLFSTPHFTGM